MRLRPLHAKPRFAAIAAGAILVLGTVPAGWCQDAPGEEADSVSDDTIDEVTVYGEKSLHTLRQELQQAEERVFDIFNALNDDDEFDIHCHERAPTGSLNKRRICMPNFLREAESEEARYWFDTQLIGRPSHVPEVKSTSRMYRELKERMDALVAEKPELQEAFIDYSSAKQNLESRRDERQEK